MTTGPTAVARGAALLVLLPLLGLGLAAPAAAQHTAAPAAAAQDTAAPAAAQGAAEEWGITAFDAALEVTDDGTLRVTETIEVEFLVPSRGIYRELPFRVPFDDDSVRRYRFDRIEVTSPTGAPTDLDESTAGDYLVWRIGDPDTYLTGRQTYQLSYRARGVLNRFDEHDELFWNVTGDRWEVPIEAVTATVTAPAVSDVRCLLGPTGGTDPCPEAEHDGGTARFAGGPVPAGEQLDIVVAMPVGAVNVAPPELQPANPLTAAFRADPPRLVGAGAVALAGLAGLIALIRRNRDRPPAPDAGGSLPGGVEYRPPDGLRPAQLRTLLSGWVDPTALSATVVDLAVRGRLRIEELPGSKSDWLLHRLPPGEEVTGYERTVLAGLFDGRTDPVKVSDLGNGKFHKHYAEAKGELYADAVSRGFYRRHPVHVRAGYLAAAAAVVVAGGAALVAVAPTGVPIGWLLLPVPIFGLALLVLGFTVPGRTAAGATMRRRAEGFREFIRTAEADRMAFAERERIFADYLPYAMAFGCVDQWVKAFARLGVPASAAAAGWYVGTTPFDAGRLSQTMTSLGSTVGGAMQATSSGSGSSGFGGGGFSGGGAGGGGGGRW